MKSKLGLTLLFLAISQGPLFSSGQPANGQQAEPKHARFPASRTILEGEVWLTWNIPVQASFAEAALAGYRVGYDEGCEDATANQKGTRAGDRKKPKGDACPNGGRFRNEALRYSQQMTDFYTRYPEDRDLPLAYLIHMLMGRKPKTLLEIHQWVSSIGH
jgi:hypothetical protein